jgi:undecaprenyl-diphosphatase
MRQQIHAFDRVVGRWVDRLPRWIHGIMELFTLLGQPPFTVGISAVALGYGLALDKQFYINAGFIAIATITIGALLKIPLHRARPKNDYVKNMMFQTFSFPSGHAAGSLVSYGLAAVIIAGKWPELTLVAWISAMVGMFLVSLSRIYLGAHFPSDIIGGWLVGGFGLVLIFLLER